MRVARWPPTDSRRGEQLEYRIVERNLDVVSRDGRASRSVMVSERDPISVRISIAPRFFSAPLTSRPAPLVPFCVGNDVGDCACRARDGLPRTDEALKDVVKLERESFLVHYSLPLSVPYTVLSDNALGSRRVGRRRRRATAASTFCCRRSRASCA
jgi:hypothetical protein